MSGPAGKPTVIKELEGNPGKQALPSGFVEPAGDADRPRHVTGYAAEVWDRVVGSMPPGVYRRTDSETLAAYCIAAKTMREASLRLEIEGAVVMTVRGPRRNPWDTVLNSATEKVIKIGARLGLDPLARENIAAPRAPVGGGKFAGLVGIDGGKAAG